MGNEFYNESNPYQYGIFKTESKPGETGILVNPRGQTDKNYIDRYTQIECIEYHKERRPNSNFLGTREYNPVTKKYGKYVWKSWTQVYDLSTYFLYGITKYKLCPETLVDDDILGKNIKMRFMGFYSRTREEWKIADFGCQMDSITIITIYDTLGIDSLEYLLKQTGLVTILSETKNLDTILKMSEQNKLGNVRNIIYIHCNEEKENLEETIKKLKKMGLNIISYENIIETGKKCVEEKDKEILNKKYRRVKPDDVFLLCYTSGTTNNPKGVMITSRPLLLTPNFAYNIGYHFTDQDVHLSFLPLAHFQEHMLFALNLVYGVQNGFYSGDNNKLFEDAQELKPTIFGAVPRIYDRLYQAALDLISNKSSLYKKMFNKAIDIKIYNYEKYGKLNHALFDRIFFNKIKNLLGGRVIYMLSGSAAMKKYILQRIIVMMGCPFLQGYGLTEGNGTTFINSMHDTFTGTIGGVENTSEIKLVDLPAFNYLTTDVNPETGVYEPRGELCFRGHIFKGYFKNLEETNNMIDKDGWLHSGDVAIFLTKNGNAIKIIDRVKNLFKLSQGEFVAPDKIQNILVNSKYTLQIFLYGESQYNYCVALVYPKLNECIKFLKENKKLGNIDYDKISYDDLCKNKIMEDEIFKDCDKFGRKYGLKGFELPKKIRIINEPFSVQNDLMTPNSKLKSKKIKIRYSVELKELYIA